MTDPIPFPNRSARDDQDGVDEARPDTDHSALCVGQNLKRLRTRRGYSLERLAKLSGVSRAMLSQIELGRSAPSINIVFKIARTFDVPFSAMLADDHHVRARLMPAADSKILSSASGKFSTRALFPFDALRKAEFYELRLAPGGRESAEPHAAGTVENLVLVRGLVEVTTRGETYRMAPGDAFLFQADSFHSYQNLDDSEALLYLVMTYRDSAG
jgi:transcriptional regulator with XRE-family HTH domain